MDKFLTVHPEWKTYAGNIQIPASPAIPQDMRETLQGKNVSGYNKGFVTLVNPADYNDLLALWGFEPDQCFPFLKFAFGQLIFFHDTKFRIMDPVINVVEVIGDDDDFNYIMNDLLVNEGMLVDNLLMGLYLQTVDKLGAPDLYECYAFVPALGLGGDKDIDNIQKVKYKEQLIILSQL
jgi:hypothetical protein